MNGFHPQARSLLFAVFLIAGVMSLGSVAKSLGQEESGIEKPKRRRAPEPALVQLKGKIASTNGAPLGGVKVFYFGFDLKLPLRQEAGVSKADGRIELNFKSSNQELYNTGCLLAFTDDRSQACVVRIPFKNYKAFLASEIEFKLEPVSELRLRVVDAARKPIAEASTGLLTKFPYFAVGTTGEDGVATYYLPKSEKVECVAAWKSKLGLDYHLYTRPAENRDLDAATPGALTDKPIELTLDGAYELRVVVQDEESKPVAGQMVYPWLLRKETEPDQINLSLFYRIFTAQTDERGKATIDWIPKWQKSGVTIWTHSEEYSNGRLDGWIPSPEAAPAKLSVQKNVSVTGSVKFLDGRPAAGMLVKLRTDRNESAQATTDRDGFYELLVPPGSNTIVCVEDEKWAAASFSGFSLERGKDRELPSLSLRPATKIRGVLLDEETGQPAPGEYMLLAQYGRPVAKLDGQLEEESANIWDANGVRAYQNGITNEKGEFEFHVGPGYFTVNSSRGNGQAAVRLEVKDELEIEVSLKAVILKTLKLSGKVVDKSTGKAAARAIVESMTTGNRIPFKTKSDETGGFHVERESDPYLLRVYSEDGKLGAYAELEPKQTEIIIELLPVGSVRGIAIDPATKKPLANAKIRTSVGIWDPAKGIGAGGLGQTATTDENGRFQVDQVIQGRNTTIYCDQGERHVRLGDFTLQSEKTLDLGVIAEIRE